MTVANKPGHRGEHEATVKTIARGMLGVSGVTVVTNARVYYHYTRGCGRIERPAFPAPSDVSRADVPAKLARLRGKIAKLCLQCCLKFESVGWAKGALRAVPTISAQIKMVGSRSLSWGAHSRDPLA